MIVAIAGEILRMPGLPKETTSRYTLILWTENIEGLS